MNRVFLFHKNYNILEIVFRFLCSSYLSTCELRQSPQLNIDSTT